MASGGGVHCHKSALVGGGRLRGLLGRSKLILSLSSLMGASVCSQSWTQTGLGGKLEQAQPPARNVCQWHGAVPVPLLGSGSGSLILHGPGSRAAGDARAYQNFTSRHDLPVYGFCGDRHPMRPPYGYFSNWAYARRGLEIGGSAKSLSIVPTVGWQIRNKRCATASFASRCRVELSQRQLCLIPAHRASSS